MRKKTYAPNGNGNRASVHSLQHAAARREADSAQPATLDLAPIFKDPRCNSERRVRSSVFFAADNERRHRNRRNACMIDSEWWISRNYAELSE